MEDRMRIETELTRMFAIRAPILLAPMAGVAGGALAAAVTGAGGLGFIGGGYGDREWLEREIAAAGNARLGIGFITWSLARQPALLDLALDRAPEAVFLSFGDIAPFAATVAASSSRLIAQVQTLDQARRALDAGADVLVAQGTEAGGHGGARATLPFVPAVVDLADRVQVVAAGGIADGRGLAASLMLGAAGVLCGTAFFAAREALSHPNAKKAAVAGFGDDTLRSSVIDIARRLDWPADWNIRTLRNAFLSRWEHDTDGLREAAAEEGPRYMQAAAAGDMATAATIVGEAVDLVRSSRPAAAILTAMEEEAIELLSRAPDILVSRG
jgi:nitronate monooxygenase